MQSAHLFGKRRDKDGPWYAFNGVEFSSKNLVLFNYFAPSTPELFNVEEACEAQGV